MDSKSTVNPHPRATHQRDLAIASQFLSFNDRSRSPFHAAHALAATLSDANFAPLSLAQDWSKTVSAGERYMFTKHGSSLVAFSLDAHFARASHVAFSVVGAHTDSPCFKLKPVSTTTAFGYIQVGVECYGGGLWHTWFDRDLTVAGRVVVRTTEGKLSVRLVSVPRPILRIPNLAIHLSRNVNTEGFKINKESDTRPILATQLAASLNESVVDKTSNSEHDKEQSTQKQQLKSRHVPLLLKVLAKEIGVSADQIVDLDLCVADTQPGAIGGALNEFVFAPRIDNLASCFTAMRSLIAASDRAGSGAGDDDSVALCRMMVCFDHEEVGSRSSHGADSPLLLETIMRICRAFGHEYERAMHRSLLISADMAHAVHPNYSAKHESNHRPALGGGLVIKTNQNQRYSTSGVSGFVVREAARRGGDVKVQEFVVPNDKPCGSTIGPILSSRSGMRTVDVGQAQLSMHSIREMCSVSDFYLCEQVVTQLLLSQHAIVDELEGVELEG